MVLIVVVIAWCTKMKMTPKDYDAVAEIFATASDKMDKGEINNCGELFENISEELSSLFQENNPNFDTKRFLKACKVT